LVHWLDGCYKCPAALCCSLHGDEPPAGNGRTVARFCSLHEFGSLTGQGW
jgi:hypothetical protein